MSGAGRGKADGREVFDLQFDAEGSTGTAGPASARQVVRGPVMWAVLAVVLIVVGVAMSRAHTPQFQVGVVNAIGQPAQLWHTERHFTPSDLGQVWLTRDALVVAGATTVAGFNRHNGDELWELRGADPRCDQPTRTQTLCVVGPNAGATELVWIDTVGGETRRERIEGLIAAGVREGDLITLVSADDGVVLQRADAESGDVRWATVMAEDVSGDFWSVGPLSMHVTQRHAIVFTPVAPDRAITIVDLHDGDDSGWHNVVQALQVEPGMWTIAVTDDDAMWQYYLTSDGAVSDAQRYGPIWELDDDPDSDVRMQWGPRQVLAIDSETGSELWSTEHVLSIMRADGAVISSSARGLQAVEERSGSQRWHHPSTETLAVPFDPIATDGTTILGSTYAGLVTIDSATGELTEIAGSARSLGNPQYYRFDNVVVEVSLDTVALWELNP